jgi:hypothetical protein
MRSIGEGGGVPTGRTLAGFTPNPTLTAPPSVPPHFGGGRSAPP